VTLGTRLALRLIAFLPFTIVFFFLPAGSLGYWPGWVFAGEFYIFSVAFAVYFLRRNPEFIKSRLQNRESAPDQRFFRILWVPLSAGGMVLSCLDYRFGWSRAWFGGTPAWLEVISQAMVGYGFVLMFRVFRTNSFASSIVEVREGQRVIDTGLYAVVRHPMYSAMLLQLVFSGPALGSYVAVPLFLVLIPVLVLRLVNEEKLLRRELPGYAEYCGRTRSRLVPGVY
jgi:protein-S-isoprenylcysteine O-methyltransferase Ste14